MANISKICKYIGVVFRLLPEPKEERKLIVKIDSEGRKEVEEDRPRSQNEQPSGPDYREVPRGPQCYALMKMISLPLHL